MAQAKESKSSNKQSSKQNIKNVSTSRTQASALKNHNFDVYASGNKESPVPYIAYLQKKLGDEAVRQLYTEQMIYPKLKMSNANNFYEREAERIADQVMTMPHKTTEEEKPLQSQQLSELISPLIQRKAEEEDDLKNEINRSPNSNQLSESEVSSDVESNIKSMKSGGQFLAESEKSFFKPGFGGIVNRVKIHNDSTAHETARAINARAFTMGDRIFFDQGQYAPHTYEGKKLLAHELAHVNQQLGGMVKTNVQRAKADSSVDKLRDDYPWIGVVSNCKKVYLRSLTDINRTIMTLAKGTKVTVLSRNGNRYKVEYKDGFVEYEGYIHKDYVNKTKKVRPVSEKNDKKLEKMLWEMFDNLNICTKHWEQFIRLLDNSDDIRNLKVSGEVILKFMKFYYLEAVKLLNDGHRKLFKAYYVAFQAGITMYHFNYANIALYYNVSGIRNKVYYAHNYLKNYGLLDDFSKQNELQTLYDIFEKKLTKDYFYKNSVIAQKVIVLPIKGDKFTVYIPFPYSFRHAKKIEKMTSDFITVDIMIANLQVEINRALKDYRKELIIEGSRILLGKLRLGKSRAGKVKAGKSKKKSQDKKKKKKKEKKETLTPARKRRLVMKIRSKDQKKTKVNDLIKFLNGLKLKRRYKWLKKMKFYKVPKKKHHFDIKLKGSDYLIYPGYTPLATVIFYRNRIPTICRNIAGVINTNQQPDLLHYIYFRNDDETKNRHKTNRSNAIRTHQGKDLGPLSYNPAGSGQSWDEYPFASTYESETRRVNVWRVPEGENWSQGGTLGPFYKNTLHRRDGALFNVRIEDAPDN